MRHFTLFRAALVVAALCLALLLRRSERSPAPSAGHGPVASAPAGQPETGQGKIPAATAPEENISHLADSLNSLQTDIRSDLRIIRDILDAFRSNFPHSGNPVGDNAEITAALTGKNKLHLALIPLDHPAINKAGELCDRWGTPFFFHAESGTRMEIRSAGPDRKMWTEDDAVASFQSSEVGTGAAR